MKKILPYLVLFFCITFSTFIWDFIQIPYNEKNTIDKRSYEVSLKTVKKMFLNLNLNNLVKNSIYATYLKIKNDKKPFDRKKITLNIYKDYLNLKK